MADNESYSLNFESSAIGTEISERSEQQYSEDFDDEETGGADVPAEAAAASLRSFLADKRAMAASFGKGPANTGTQRSDETKSATAPPQLHVSALSARTRSILRAKQERAAERRQRHEEALRAAESEASSARSEVAKVSAELEMAKALVSQRDRLVEGLEQRLAESEVGIQEVKAVGVRAAVEHQEALGELQRRHDSEVAALRGALHDLRLRVERERDVLRDEILREARAEEERIASLQASLQAQGEALAMERRQLTEARAAFEVRQRDHERERGRREEEARRQLAEERRALTGALEVARLAARESADFGREAAEAAQREAAELHRRHEALATERSAVAAAAASFEGERRELAEARRVLQEERDDAARRVKLADRRTELADTSREAAQEQLRSLAEERREVVASRRANEKRSAELSALEPRLRAQQEELTQGLTELADAKRRLAVVETRTSCQAEEVEGARSALRREFAALQRLKREFLGGDGKTHWEENRSESAVHDGSVVPAAVEALIEGRTGRPATLSTIATAMATPDASEALRGMGNDGEDLHPTIASRGDGLWTGELMNAMLHFDVGEVHPDVARDGRDSNPFDIDGTANPFVPMLYQVEEAKDE